MSTKTSAFLNWNKTMLLLALLHLLSALALSKLHVIIQISSDLSRQIISTIQMEVSQHTITEDIAKYIMDRRGVRTNQISWRGKVLFNGTKLMNIISIRTERNILFADVNHTFGHFADSFLLYSFTLNYSGMKPSANRMTYKINSFGYFDNPTQTIQVVQPLTIAYDAFAEFLCINITYYITNSQNQSALKLSTKYVLQTPHKITSVRLKDRTKIISRFEDRIWIQNKIMHGLKKSAISWLYIFVTLNGDPGAEVIPCGIPIDENMADNAQQTYLIGIPIHFSKD